MDCKWTIIRNYTYVLKFHRIDIEYNSDCKYDYLRFGEEGAKMCGNFSGIPASEKDKRRYGKTELIFHSDSSRNAYGFQIQIIREKTGIN